MMDSRAPARPELRADGGIWKWVASAIVVVGLVAGSIAIDRLSVERANRLFRAGDPLTAAELYRERAGPLPTGRAAYNLGTALLAAGDRNADAFLTAATRDADSVTLHRTYHNLAWAYLTRVDPTFRPDSATSILRESVAYGREAIRLDPEDLDSRWNLALAQLMLDSIARIRVDPNAREESGNDETPIDLVALTRSGEGTGESGLEPENPDAGESSGERRGASQGAREAWATQDPGPLTVAAATAMLAAVEDDAERLVRGILWSRRPDIAWWAAEAYPGGDW